MAARVMKEMKGVQRTSLKYIKNTAMGHFPNPQGVSYNCYCIIRRALTKMAFLHLHSTLRPGTKFLCNENLSKKVFLQRACLKSRTRISPCSLVSSGTNFLRIFYQASYLPTYGVDKK